MEEMVENISFVHSPSISLQFNYIFCKQTEMNYIKNEASNNRYGKISTQLRKVEEIK